MAIGSTKGPALNSVIPPKTRNSPKNAQNLSDAPEKRVEKAEREADRRIAQNSVRVAESEQESRQRLDQLKDEYSDQYSTETARQEEAYENLRNKGYESLSDLKRTQITEQKNQIKQGEERLKGLNEDFNVQLTSKNLEHQQQLNNIRSDQERLENYYKNDSGLQAKTSEERTRRDLEQARLMAENKLQQYDENARQQYNKIRETYAEANAKADGFFQDRLQSSLARQNGVISSVNEKATQAINTIRQDTARKLAAYDTRQRDPFYQLVDLDAKMDENDTHYTLTTRIPTHEQDNISVGISANRLILSGKRRNEEKLETTPGQFKQTSSFQSFSQSFPLEFPVNALGLTKEFDGDILRIRIPKAGSKPQETHPQKPPRLAAERPQFPDNLPTVNDPANPPQLKKGKPLG